MWTSSSDIVMWQDGVVISKDRIAMYVLFLKCGEVVEKEEV